MPVNPDDIFREVLLASVNEQRARRRWGIFFKSLFFILIFSIIFMMWSGGEEDKSGKDSNYAAVIDLKGVIGAGGNVSADDVNTALDEAFKDPKTQGIILKIDSPGGSPVEASEIYNEIFRLRHKYPDVKVYAVCTDMCTSAAYYIASATDDIYANKASLVGSIGVLIEGFGFVDTMQKLGVQRRLLMSGDHKGFLDPFSPMSAHDQLIAQGMLDQIHQQFISDVEKGRGTRLKINQDTFSGIPWTGAQAIELGLIDGFGSPTDVARTVIQAKHLKDFTKKTDFLDAIASHLGATMAIHLGEMLGIGQGVREQAGV
ncbi:MAG TPA: S49 family peptidase [Gammaproteobacteria bacterium]|nr:S49 family peptidase [Gammaproteobacteria bacterium]